MRLCRLAADWFIFCGSLVHWRFFQEKRKQTEKAAGKAEKASSA